MAPDTTDPDRLTLDANAFAGLLHEVFGTEMTDAPSRCAHCGNRAPVGALRAYGGAMGLVLRCSICAEVVVRVMRRADGGYLLDARGAAYLAVTS